jgi:hypothetical protein
LTPPNLDGTDIDIAVGDAAIEEIFPKPGKPLEPPDHPVSTHASLFFSLKCLVQQRFHVRLIGQTISRSQPPQSREVILGQSDRDNARG